MPSPFPGMNPYLESADVWHDFHERFVPAMAEAIGPRVRPNYIVKINENVYLHEVPDDERSILGRPDVAMLAGRTRASDEASVALIDAPVRVALKQLQEEGINFIELLDRESREVVTVIELLSPTNKRPGGHRDQYLTKRRGWLDARVNLVEIDLLRGGPPMPDGPRPHSDYSIFVSRATEQPYAGLWPFGLRDALPKCVIPLKPADGDMALDLRPVLDRVYDAAVYEDYVYTKPADPPLSAEDRVWAESIVAARGAGAGRLAT